VSAQCAVQQRFSFRQDREICLDLAGGQITSDAGLIALREFNHLIGFTQSIVERLCDDRHPGYIVHALFAVVIQRLYAIIAGYEDQNDADLLRHDGLFQLIAEGVVIEALEPQGPWLLKCIPPNEAEWVSGSDTARRGARESSWGAGASPSCLVSRGDATLCQRLRCRMFTFGGEAFQVLPGLHVRPCACRDVRRRLTGGNGGQR